MIETSRKEAVSLLEILGRELEPGQAAALEDCYSAPPPAPSPAPSVLCHGDVAPEHLYLEPERHRLTGIIDWGDACFGDPALDVGGLGFLAPPERLAPLQRTAEPGLLERARYRVLVAALHALWFRIRESSEADRETGLRVIGWWLPR